MWQSLGQDKKTNGVLVLVECLHDYFSEELFFFHQEKSFDISETSFYYYIFIYRKSQKISYRSDVIPHSSPVLTKIVPSVSV